jgi:chemotaxis protein CheD
MFRHRNSQFQKEIVTIHPGEYLATGDDVIIATVLGSCIAVALFDPRGPRGGLNHFMLPGNLSDASEFSSPNAKYGLYAMELLINDLLKAGSRRQDLTAKVFGGGSVLRLDSGFTNKIPQSNIDFVFSFLKTEGIPVISSDVGGTAARKVFYFPLENRVLLKRITGTLIAAIGKEEEGYLENIKKKPDSGEIVMFD